MRFTLIFLLLSSVLICSCKRTEDEEVYINALEKSNDYILDVNESIKATIVTRVSYDPRSQTQEIILKINKIDSSTLAYARELKKNKVEIKAAELGKFKKDLIRNNIDSPDWDYFFEDDFYQESKIKMIPFHVAINEVILLANQMYTYFARNLHWADMKIEKPQAIFKVDSNTYFALFAFGSKDQISPLISITSIVHNSQKLASEQYSYQYKTGFYGVIMNLTDTTNNKFGEYIVNYQIDWDQIGIKREFEFHNSNMFLIDE